LLSRAEVTVEGSVTVFRRPTTRPTKMKAPPGRMKTRSVTRNEKAKGITSVFRTYDKQLRSHQPKSRTHSLAHESYPQLPHGVPADLSWLENGNLCETSRPTTLTIKDLLNGDESNVRLAKSITRLLEKPGCITSTDVSVAVSGSVTPVNSSKCATPARSGQSESWLNLTEKEAREEQVSRLSGKYMRPVTTEKDEITSKRVSSQENIIRGPHSRGARPNSQDVKRQSGLKRAVDTTSLDMGSLRSKRSKSSSKSSANRLSSMQMDILSTVDDLIMYW